MGRFITPEIFNNLYASVIAEVNRRDGYGSISGTATAYQKVPAHGYTVLISKEHREKINNALRAINPEGLPVIDFPTAKESDVVAWEARIAQFVTQPRDARANNDCANYCTGMCITQCTTTCSSCTSCTGCTGCSGCSGCGYACSVCTGCTGCSGCGSGCADQCDGCSGSCDDGCLSGCTNACKGCTPCTSCYTGCTGCSGTCNTTCRNQGTL